MRFSAVSSKARRFLLTTAAASVGGVVATGPRRGRRLVRVCGVAAELGPFGDRAGDRRIGHYRGVADTKIWVPMLVTPTPCLAELLKLIPRQLGT